MDGVVVIPVEFSLLYSKPCNVFIMIWSIDLILTNYVPHWMLLGESRVGCYFSVSCRSPVKVLLWCDSLEGVHLEGPFINKEKKGAHEECLISSLSNGMSDVREVYGSLENVSIITLAPELPGALDVVRQLTDAGIAVSLGQWIWRLCLSSSCPVFILELVSVFCMLKTR